MKTNDAATESQGAELHREFCAFLLNKLREKDEHGASLMSASWGTVIRSFLNDNSITMVPDNPGTPLGDLAAEFRGRRPPRVTPPAFDPEVDGEVH
jgi:hypothetical protein